MACCRWCPPRFAFIPQRSRDDGCMPRPSRESVLLSLVGGVVGVAIAVVVLVVSKDVSGVEPH